MEAISNGYSLAVLRNEPETISLTISLELYLYSIIAKVYQNTGGSYSEDTNITLTGVTSGEAVFGDSDNDGDLDANRTIGISPQTSQQGVSTIHVCAYDGNLSSCQSFQVFVKPTLQWQNPMPQTIRINDIWGISESNLFIASQWGSILHYNGIS